MNKAEIKIFGERNTGTNYLEKLIKKNIDAKIIEGIIPYRHWLNHREIGKNIYFYLNKSKNLGWKHSIPSLKTIEEYNNKPNLGLVLSVKNPYSYLLSLYKKPYHISFNRKISFEEFLISEVKTVWRDNLGLKYYNNPVDIWNIKIQAYLKLKEAFQETVIVKYEDLLADPENVIMRISNDFNFNLSGQFININKSTKEEDKNYNFYKDYYLNELWKIKLDSHTIEIINGKLDKNLVEQLGYKILQ